MQARSSYRLHSRPDSTALSARGLTKSFARGLARAARRTVAIDNVDIDLRAGELVALVGCEGSGKTALLQCLCGLLRRDSGIVELGGETFEGGGCPPQISYVPAVPLFYPFLTVRDVLQFRAARELCSSRRDEAVENALSALELSDESACRISVLPRDLLKRLAVAEALISDPSVILVDTAVAETGSQLARRALSALHDRARSGAAILVAVRDASAVAFAVSRIMFMEQGRIKRAFSFDPEAVFAADSGLVAPTSRFVAERIH